MEQICRVWKCTSYSKEENAFCRNLDVACDYILAQSPTKKFQGFLETPGDKIWVKYTTKENFKKTLKAGYQWSPLDGDNRDGWFSIEFVNIEEQEENHND